MPSKTIPLPKSHALKPTRRRASGPWVPPAQLYREIGEAFRRWQAGRGYRRDPHS